MKRISLICAGTLLASCHTAPDLAPTPELSGNYALDPSHASIVWSISHAGLSHYTARFNDISGTLDYNSIAPEKSRVDIRIDPASVSTGQPEFDKTIGYGKRYFNAEKFPEIRFISDSITRTGDNTGLITGALTFRGQTRPVTLDTVFNGAGKSFGNPGQTLGFSATGTLKRSDFGLTYLSNFGIGDDITLRIETEFNEKH